MYKQLTNSRIALDYLVTLNKARTYMAVDDPSSHAAWDIIDDATEAFLEDLPTYVKDSILFQITCGEWHD